MELLGKIFGSVERIRLMRLFLFHPQKFFTRGELVHRTQSKENKIKEELALLENLDFLRTKQIHDKEASWSLNAKFSLLEPIHTLLLDSELIKEKDIVTHLKKTGSLKLVLLSGIFLNQREDPVDMLVVIDKLKKDLFEQAILSIESEVGKEISYALFTVEEFNYRNGMNDKLMRNILENSHRKIFNTILK